MFLHSQGYPRVSYPIHRVISWSTPDANGDEAYMRIARFISRVLACSVPCVVACCEYIVLCVRQLCNLPTKRGLSCDSSDQQTLISAPARQIPLRYRLSRRYAQSHLLRASHEEHSLRAPSQVSVSASTHNFLNLALFPLCV
jgi:hypothetical protein